MKAQERFIKEAKMIEKSLPPTVRKAQKSMLENNNILSDSISPSIKFIQNIAEPLISSFSDLMSPSVSIAKEIKNSTLSICNDLTFPALGIAKELGTSTINSFADITSPAISAIQNISALTFNVLSDSVPPISIGGIFESKSENYLGLRNDNLISSGLVNLYDTNYYQSNWHNNNELNRIDTRLVELEDKLTKFDSIFNKETEINPIEIDFEKLDEFLDSPKNYEYLFEKYHSVSETKRALAEAVCEVFRKSMLSLENLISISRDNISSEIDKLKRIRTRVVRILAGTNRKVNLRREHRKLLKVLQRKNTEEEENIKFFSNENYSENLIFNKNAKRKYLSIYRRAS